MSAPGSGEDRWAAVWSLVRECEELPSGQWREHLAALGTSESMAEEVLKILRESESVEPAMPENIGGYRILRKIAEGGMGAVYQAEQAQPRRVVAIKTIRPGHVTGRLLRRFELEGQMLGRLQHPGIAQIYESGMSETPFGRMPFFAMEYVDGATLLDFATQNNLNLKQRLLLMLKICSAVQHAHEQGIVHRDLKPSNILVTKDAQPKVLDFGVARLTDLDSSVTRQTGMGELLGTLEYMSPEQVSGDAFTVDARSDIYALGVILYELLSGRLPYDIRNKPVTELVRTICSDDPTPLGLAGQGDLGIIAAKALEKEKSRRYASAAALADDIGRYLDDQPIAARPPTTAYQLQKFARRHRAVVWGALSVLVTLVAGIGVSVYEAVRATRAEQSATAINRFLLQDLLGQADPRQQAAAFGKPDPDMKVRALLDRATARVGDNFAGQPEAEAAIRETLGVAYYNLGISKSSMPLFEKSLAIRERLASTPTLDTARTLTRLARTYRTFGRYEEAERTSRKAIALQTRIAGEQDPQTLTSMNSLVFTLLFRDKYQEAEQLGRKVSELRAKVLGPEHADTLLSGHNLALVLAHESKWKEAEQLYGQVLEAQRRVLGPQHPDTLATAGDYAKCFQDHGKFQQAAELFENTLELQRRTLGETHSNTINSLLGLGFVYTALGRYAEAEPVIKRSLEVDKGPGTELDLATLYLHAHRLREALPIAQHALEGLTKARGPRSRRTLEAISVLAAIHAGLGHATDAVRLLTPVPAIAREQRGIPAADLFKYTNQLAELLIQQRDSKAAETVLRGSLDSTKASKAPSWQQAYAQSLLGEVLILEARKQEAIPLLQSGLAHIEEHKDLVPAYHRGVVKNARKWAAAN